MKKKFVKTPEGAMVEATEAQIADASVEKIELDVQIKETPKPEDPIKELTELVRSISGDYKARAAEMEAQIAAFKKAQEKGLIINGPMPDGDPEKAVFADTFEKNAKEAGIPVKEAREIFAHYDLAYQGKQLMEKIFHPKYVIDDKKRIELAKYFCLVIRAGVSGDLDAKRKLQELYGSVSKVAIGDPTNVFPLPDIVDSEILQFARESSVILQYARQWNMTSDKQSFPAENAAVSVAWGNTTNESEPGITEVELENSELSAYSAVKNATMMDARSDIVSWLTSALAEAAGLELDNQAFNGNGSPYIGMLGADGAGYSVVLAGSLISGLTAPDLSNMIAKLDGLKKQGARFFMHGQTLHYVRTLSDDNKRPIFVETVGTAVPGSIYGYPYTEVIKMPSTQAANTAFILFGNLRYFAVGRRLDVSTLSVDPYGLWTTNRTRFKLYQRWALKCALPLGLVRLLTSA